MKDVCRYSGLVPQLCEVDVIERGVAVCPEDNPALETRYVLLVLSVTFNPSLREEVTRLVDVRNGGG